MFGGGDGLGMKSVVVPDNAGSEDVHGIFVDRQCLQGSPAADATPITCCVKACVGAHMQNVFQEVFKP